MPAATRSLLLPAPAASPSAFALRGMGGPSRGVASTSAASSAAAAPQSFSRPAAIRSLLPVPAAAYAVLRGVSGAGGPSRGVASTSTAAAASPPALPPQRSGGGRKEVATSRDDWVEVFDKGSGATPITL